MEALLPLLKPLFEALLSFLWGEVQKPRTSVIVETNDDDARKAAKIAEMRRANH